MPIPAWRAAQTTSTTGTGTIVLNAAPTTRRSFQAAFGAGSIRIGYVIQGTTFWEVGLGDFDGASPGNLTRITVLASSNSNALVSLPAGTADVFAFLDPASRALVASTATTVALTVADLGNLVVWSGTVAGTATLPAVATVPPGNGYLITNRGTVNLTIDPSAAEQINGAATLVLLTGDAVECFVVAGAWVATLTKTGTTFPSLTVTGAATVGSTLAVTGVATAANGTTGTQVVNFGQFPATIASVGTTTLPNGLIMKWGTGSTTSGVGSITFAVAFPTALLNIQLTISGGTGAASLNPLIAGALGAASVSVYGNSAQSLGFFWLALGN